MANLEERSFRRSYCEYHQGRKFEIPGNRIVKDFIYLDDLQEWAQQSGHALRDIASI